MCQSQFADLPPLQGHRGAPHVQWRGRTDGDPCCVCCVKKRESIPTSHSSTPMIAYALHILDTRKKGLTCSLGIACKRRLLLHIIFTAFTQPAS